MLSLLVHVVGNRAHVVKELRVDGPTLVLVPHRLAHHLALAFLNGIPQQKTLSFKHAVAQTLVVISVVVHRFRRAGKPTLVDAASVDAQGIPIGRSQLDSLARVKKAARNPRRGEPQDTLTRVHGALQNLANIIFRNDLRCTHVSITPRLFGHKSVAKQMFVPIGSRLGFAAKPRCTPQSAYRPEIQRQREFPSYRPT